MAEDALLDALEALSPTSKRFFDQSLGLLDWCEPTEAPVVSPDMKPRARKRNLDAEKTAKANARRSRHRDKEKRELMFLRACNDALEKELASLQGQEEARREARRMRELEFPTGAWRALALIRRRERKEAEQENLRLRALWRSQMLFVAQMQQLGQIQRDIAPAGGYEARVTFSGADVDALGVLTEELETLYEQSGRILSNIGVSARPERGFYEAEAKFDKKKLYSSRHRDAEHRGTSLKFFANGAIRLRSEQNARHRTISIKTRHQAASSSKDRDVVDILMAIRQYKVAPDRHVVVWKGIVSGRSALKGAVASEFGVCVIHRAISDANHSINRRMRRIEPMTSTSSKEARSTIFDDKRLSEVTLAATERVVGDALSVIGFEEV